MCRRVACKSCGKPTWAGCGAHIEQVLGDIPRADRCKCRESKGAGTKRPETNAPREGGGLGGLIRRLFRG